MPASLYAEAYPKRVPSMACAALAILLSLEMIGCGLADSTVEAEPSLSSTAQAVISSNKLSMNALSANGLAMNGINLNGLAMNGLAMNGLSTDTFHDWFNEDPVLREELMRYLVGCAVPEGETRTYLNPFTGISYTWTGELGLAPHWARGQPAREVEQQVVSACLAARVNAFGISVSISVLGLTALGQPVPYTAQELESHSVREACFFGNLFLEQGVYSANDGLSLAPGESSPRVCGLPDADGASQCPPMVYAGSCAQLCQPDPTQTYYTSCTYNGTTYLPITTRMRSQDITP